LAFALFYSAANKQQRGKKRETVRDSEGTKEARPA
jgi:hypothetical protein